MKEKHGSNSVNISSEIGTEDFNCFATGPGHGICSSNGVLIIPVLAGFKRKQCRITISSPSCSFDFI